LTNLQTLTFGYFFNNGDQPLGTSLDKITSLKTIKFGNSFNNGYQPLGTSLQDLPNLRSVTKNGKPYP
jgi:hypothetical protein